MTIDLWIKSPVLRHEGDKYDIFGPMICLESDSGISIVDANKIKSVSVPEEPRKLIFNYKNGDVETYYEISEYEFNEILCWATANKLIYELIEKEAIETYEK